MSQGVLDHKGFKIMSSGGQVKIMKDNMVYIQGKRITKSNMYPLDIFVTGKANLAEAERSLDELHKVLGHPDINKIKNMAKKGCASKLKIVEHSNDKERCGNCQAGKGHHASHPSSSRERSNILLHRVHADLVGPINPPSLGGSRYFMLLRDEYSSFMHVYFFRDKTQTLSKIKKYINEATIAAQMKVQILRTDNGSEFKNRSVSMLLDSEDIIQEFSAPRTAQQNGEIERANRTVIETARTLLKSSGLPLSLWGEAILCSVYLRNRITNSRNHDKTPFEMFHGKVPTYDHLVEFGREMHLLDSNRGLSKFSSKTKEVYMVGYGNRVNTYRVWNPKTNDIVVSSDVVKASHDDKSRQQNLSDRPMIVITLDGENSGSTEINDHVNAVPNDSLSGDALEAPVPMISQET